MENSERISIIIKYYVMWCNLCKFEQQIQIQYKQLMHCYVSDVKPIYITDNRGYKADFFRLLLSCVYLFSNLHILLFLSRGRTTVG